MFRKTFNKKLISTMVAVATVFSLMVTPAFAAADSGVAITGGNLSGVGGGGYYFRGLHRHYFGWYTKNINGRLGHCRCC